MAHKKMFSRPDGTYLNKIDPLMRFLPFVMKGRNESAVYFRQQIDVTSMRTYLKEKNREVNATGVGAKATIFHAMLAAVIKTMHERPQLNRFIIGQRVYQRNRLSIAFVVKSEFKDDANEEILVMNFEPGETMQDISAKIQQEIHKIRAVAMQKTKERHGAVNWLNYLISLPRFILRGAVRFLTAIDYHGWLPGWVIDVDPMHSSIFISNLGSLNIDAPYHHLYEWGTTSVFMTIGVVHRAPVVMPDGQIASREVLNIALTLDERISDGYYFAKTIKRFQHYMENPAELDKPDETPVNRTAAQKAAEPAANA
jgi:chloramphenicol O-acetyltransferase